MRFLGSYTKTDNTLAQMVDVFFAGDSSDTLPNDWVSISSTIDALPDAAGSGNVYSLHEAMARDASGDLQGLVEDFIAATDAATRNTLLDQIIYKWAGVDGVDPASRNSSGGSVDARQLAALEAFLGRAYVSGYGGPNPIGTAESNGLTDSYHRMAERVYAQLAAQTFLASYFDQAVMTIGPNGRPQFDFSSALASLFNVSTPESTILEFYRVVFGSQLSPDLIDYSDLLNKAATAVPSYIDDINDVVAPYYQGQMLRAEYYDGQTVKGGLGNDYLVSETTGGVIMYGYDGNDTLVAMYGKDTLFGGSGNDTITGGPNADLVYGEAGDDLFVFNYGDGAVGDSIDGGSGSNTLKVNGGADISAAVIQNVQILDISSGNWVIMTGDQVAEFSTITNGSTTTRLSIQAASAGAYDFTGKTSVPVYFYGTASSDTFIGTAGDDFILANGGDDAISGMGGNDTIYANYGGELLIAGGDGDDIISIGNSPAAGSTIDGGSGNNTLLVGNTDISNVVLSNIQTMQVAYGNIILTADQLSGMSAISGNAVLQAAVAGTYDISGKVTSGSFDLYGSAGDDILKGNDAAQTINGNQGDDTIYGEGGNDYLFGGPGDNIIYGGDGNDSFYSYSTGLQALYGDAGDDSITLGANLSAGSVVDGGSGNNTLYVSNVDLTGTTVSNIQQLTINSSVTLNATQFSGFAALSGNGDIYATTAGTYDFSNKTVTGSFNLYGSSGDDILKGDDAPQWINGYAGNDTIYGGGGADYLNGGDGNNTVYGGDGNDYLYCQNGGIQVVYGDAGDDTVSVVTAALSAGSIIDGGSGNNMLSVVSADITEASITNMQTLSVSGYALLSGAQLAGFSTITGYAQIIAASAGTYDLSGKTLTGLVDMYGTTGNDVFKGSDGSQYLSTDAGDDTLYGMGGDDYLYAGSGNDTLIGGSGTDYLSGSAGSDTYIFGAGDGTDTISDYDSYGIDTDVLSFGAGINNDQLWFSQSGNNLVVQLIGTADAVTISNWYGGTSYHVEQIQAGGHTLVDTQVQNLVDAMAGITMPTTTTMSQTYHNQLDPVIAASWT